MKRALLGGAAAFALVLASCQTPAPAQETSLDPPPAAERPEPPVPPDPAKFLADAEKRIDEFSEYAARIQWVNANFITYDTDWLASKVGSEGTQLQVALANGTKAFEGVALDSVAARKMGKLRTSIVMPAPSAGTPEQAKAKADELAAIQTRMQSTYATGKYTIGGKEMNLDELSNIVEQSRDPAKLKEAWEGWRTVSPSMRADYARMVEIGNDGARELGFDNIADMWLSNYDMPPEQMSDVTTPPT